MLVSSMHTSLSTAQALWWAMRCSFVISCVERKKNLWNSESKSTDTTDLVYKNGNIAFNWTWMDSMDFNRLYEWKFDLEWSKYVTLHRNILTLCCFISASLFVLFRRNGIQVGAYVSMRIIGQDCLSSLKCSIGTMCIHWAIFFSLFQCKAVCLWSVEALSQCVELTFDSQTKNEKKKWTIRFVVHTRTIAHINGMLVLWLLLLMPCFILSSFLLLPILHVQHTKSTVF